MKTNLKRMNVCILWMLIFVNCVSEYRSEDTHDVTLANISFQWRMLLFMKVTLSWIKPCMTISSLTVITVVNAPRTIITFISGHQKSFLMRLRRMWVSMHVYTGQLCSFWTLLPGGPVMFSFHLFFRFSNSKLDQQGSCGYPGEDVFEFQKTNSWNELDSFYPTKRVSQASLF